MKNTLLIILIAFSYISAAAQTYKIEYKKYFENNETEAQNPIIVFSNKNENYILSEQILNGKEKIPYEITRVDTRNFVVTNYGFLKDNQTVSASNDSIIYKYKFELTDDTKKILNYTCHKAITTVNSNKIEIWYTNALKINGSPSVLGQKLGLVLEIISNGNRSTKACSIQKVKNFVSDSFFVNKKNTSTDNLTYNDLMWKSKFITIHVFENQVINFDDNYQQSDSSIKRFANGTVVLKRVTFPEIEAGNSIFVKLTEQSNGDAYDRTGSVFLIPENRDISFYDALSKGINNVPVYQNGNGKSYQGVAITDNYLPMIELMRFFTPFGISQYNYLKQKDKEWEQSVSYRQDISEFNHLLSGKSFWIGTFIGNYDKGGHKINLEITIHNDGMNNFSSDYILPLINTTNVMEMAGQEYGTMFSDSTGMTIEFTLEQDIKKAKLRYITTGHGGWENGDEFVPKQNRIFLDGVNVYSFTPWRTDCGCYRLYNPASGNFSNGLSSSDFSRSNWCPGTTTNPIYIELGNLQAGKHTLRVQIPLGKREGGSFSAWNVSACLIGN